MIRPGSVGELAAAVRTLAAGHCVRAGIDLDLSQLCDVIEVDETSITVTVQAGITAASLEDRLAGHGLTLGALPTASRSRTVGALLAAPRASEASPRFGRFTRRCLAIWAVMADGTEISTRGAPRKATGPDLMYALVGARGTSGILTAATLRLERRSPRRALVYQLDSVRSAATAARAFLGHGARPAELEVVGSQLDVILDGPRALADAEQALCDRLVAAQGGHRHDEPPPPRLDRAAHERAASLGDLERAIDATTTHVTGWHAAGAAVIDARRPPAELAPPSPLRVALKSGLDPDGRFPTFEAQRP